MQFIKNLTIPGSSRKPIAIDLVFASQGKLPVVIYAHGFNGFKDWGNADMMAEEFARAGFIFLKFNFSHNGTTPEQPEDFVDLEAFGNNNFSKQLEDLGNVMNWVCDVDNTYSAHMDANKIYLVGHSMGGGVCILYASRDQRIKKLITWASISVCKTPWGSWPPEKIKEWEQKGVQYYTNSRTKQEMPLYYQLFKDYEDNKPALDIEVAIKKLTIPILICHGSSDTSVLLESAEKLKAWQPSAELFVLETDHVFGRKHPWTENSLPAPMQKVIDKSIEFLKAKN